MDKERLRDERELKIQQRKAKVRRQKIILLAAAGILLVSLIFLCRKLFMTRDYQNNEEKQARVDTEEGAPPVDVQLLSVNPYSRPGTSLKKVNGIVVHYTANPGTSAQANRNYFEGLKDSHITSASSHYIIGIDGEIIQCVPLNEWAYASNERNEDTLSIECCHPGEDGKFTDETYRSLIQLTGWLCKRYELTEKDVIRHHDVTGKLCPKYFVENEDAWNQFLTDLKEEIQRLNTAEVSKTE